MSLNFPDKGEVFVWGYGILGKGPNLSESSTPEMIPPTLFGRSEFNPSVSITKIRCGLSHFAAVTGKKLNQTLLIKLLPYSGVVFHRPVSPGLASNRVDVVSNHRCGRVFVRPPEMTLLSVKLGTATSKSVKQSENTVVLHGS